MDVGGGPCREEQARDRENRAGARSVMDVGGGPCREEQARDRENGSVAVLACGLVAVAVVLTLAVVAVGGAVVLAGRAEAAADAAALAATDSVALGLPSLACTAAGRVAELDGARLIECHVEPDAVEVVVELVGDPPVALGRSVRARSRAEVDLSRTRAGAEG
jgi:secretion/DNA translocation related TadE-like protein